MSNSRLDQSTPTSKPPAFTAATRATLDDALARGDDFQLLTGDYVRRLQADLAELRELRRERAGGKVFKRAGSTKWQLRYLVGDRWVDESSGTTDKH